MTSAEVSSAFDHMWNT